MKRKQRKRPQRMQDAKTWLPTYTRQKLFSAYRKRYGVDWPTTFTELAMLGIPIDPAYQAQVLRTVQLDTERKRQKKLAHTQGADPGLGFDQDETFAYIVGYTSGGAPYGLTWDEWQQRQDDVESTPVLFMPIAP